MRVAGRRRTPSTQHELRLRGCSLGGSRLAVPARSGGILTGSEPRRARAFGVAQWGETRKGSPRERFTAAWAGRRGRRAGPRLGRRVWRHASGAGVGRARRRRVRHRVALVRGCEPGRGGSAARRPRGGGGAHSPFGGGGHRDGGRGCRAGPGPPRVGAPAHRSGDRRNPAQPRGGVDGGPGAPGVRRVLGPPSAPRARAHGRGRSRARRSRRRAGGAESPRGRRGRWRRAGVGRRQHRLTTVGRAAAVVGRRGEGRVGRRAHAGVGAGLAARLCRWRGRPSCCSRRERRATA